MIRTNDLPDPVVRCLAEMAGAPGLAEFLLAEADVRTAAAWRMDAQGDQESAEALLRLAEGYVEAARRVEAKAA